MTSAVDGLISGMSTTQVISQLMQVESIPQQKLQAKLSIQNKITSAYQSVNTRLSALLTAAKAFTDKTTSGAFSLAKATSSSDAVTATASGGATPGTFAFAVTALAAAQVSTASVPATGAVTTGSGLDVKIGTTTTHINVTTDSAAGVASAVNAANIGVKASVVTTDTGTVLQFTAAKTGTANAFTVSGLSSGSPNVATAAADAKLTVGSGAGSYTVSSSTNSFTGVIANVTLTANRVQSGVTVTVTADENAIADKMQAFVDAANSALDEIKKQTAYDPASKKGAPLGGNFTVRHISDSILSAVSGGKSGYGSFKQLGVALDKSGKVTFDRTAFLAAYEADPAKTQMTLTDAGGVGVGGLATQLSTVATTATDSTIGSITTALQGVDSTVRDLNDRIAAWDVRLDMKKTALQRQFSGLEVALGKLKNQSGWLSSQLASLPSGR